MKPNTPVSVVDSLAAEVVHLVVVGVLFVEEGGNLSDGIPVPGQGAPAGEAHGDDLVCDVRQVEVDPVHLVTTFVLEEFVTLKR